MKTITRFLALSTIMIGFLALAPFQSYAQERNVSFQVFYDELSPYGNWVDYPGNGYVWVPNAGPDFMPYSTAGYWAMTDYGWTWVSEYNWGWAPFHYGRWDFNPSYGWFWMPDEVWGPAWVSWRHAPGYYGWAPLGPGMSMEMATRGGYEMREDRWIFMDEHHFGDRDMRRYYAPRERRSEFARNSTVINNTYIDNNRHTTYIAGPRREEVQQVTRTSIRPVAVRESNTPGQSLRNNELNIYRPVLSRNDESREKPAPKNVQPFDARKNLPSNPNRGQDMPNDRLNHPNNIPAPGHPQPDNRPLPGGQRQDQLQQRPQQHLDQNRPQQAPPAVGQPGREQPRQDQLRQEPPRQAPRMEQPRPEQRIEQPRQEPRLEQPRPEQRIEPRMEQPRPEPRMEPRQEQRIEEPRQEPRMEQPRQEPRMEQPRQEPERERK